MTSDERYPLEYMTFLICVWLSAGTGRFFCFAFLSFFFDFLFALGFILPCSSFLGFHKDAKKEQRKKDTNDRVGMRSCGRIVALSLTKVDPNILHANKDCVEAKCSARLLGVKHVVGNIWWLFLPLFQSRLYYGHKTSSSRLPPKNPNRSSKLPSRFFFFGLNSGRLKWPRGEAWK